MRRLHPVVGVDGGLQRSGRRMTVDRHFANFDHAQYRLIYDTVLAACLNGRLVFFYVLNSLDVAWYALPGSTLKVLDATGSVGIDSR